jgi:hypothetical protein
MNTVFNASQPSTWLLREVQDAIDDPRPSVSHAEAERRWESQANQLRNRVRAAAKELAEV